MTAPINRITPTVSVLPEVGDTILQQARAIDARQVAINAAQEELTAARGRFLAELRDEWTPEEMLAAGVVA